MLDCTLRYSALVSVVCMTCVHPNTKNTHTVYICGDLWLGKYYSLSSSALWQEMLNTLRLVVGGGRSERGSIVGVGCGGMMLSTGRSWQMGENGTE